MRAKVLILPLLLSVAMVSEAHAEKVRINQAAKVFARAGERSKVLAKLKAGEKVTVISKDGRWLKVRAQGRTGWIVRTVADVPEGEEIARNTRRRAFVDGRGKDRGSLGDAGPDDRVGADATGDSGGGGDDDDDDDDKPKPKNHKPDKPDKPDKGHKAKGDDDDDDDDTKSKGGGDDDDVAVSDDEEPKRKTVRVATKTTAFEKADKSSDSQFTATPDDELFLTGKVGAKWTEVENSEGELGYVLTSKLDLPDEDELAAMNAPLKRELDLRVRAGFTILQQGLRTVGGKASVPDNYNVGVPAGTLALGGQYLKPYSAKVLVGGELAYAYAKAVPGLKYTPMGGAATTIPFSVHDLDVRGLVGYDLKKRNGMMLMGRLGFRYYSFQVADVGVLAKNPATIPSEIRISPAFGAGLAMPRITPKIGVHVNLDFLVSASFAQTKGLEDGVSPAAKGLALGGVFDYAIQKGLDFTATYDLNYTSATFGAPAPMSLRAHAGAVSRTDIFHMITLGITKGF